MGVPRRQAGKRGNPEQCLVREIEEELGIQIEVGQIYQAVHAHYDHGDFLIIAYLARQVEGEISLSVHSAYAWVDVDKLDQYDLADANVPIARSLKEDGQSAWAGMGANGGTD